MQYSYANWSFKCIDKTTDSVTLKFFIKHFHVVIFQYNGLCEQAIDLFWPSCYLLLTIFFDLKKTSSQLFHLF